MSPYLEYESLFKLLSHRLVIAEVQSSNLTKFIIQSFYFQAVHVTICKQFSHIKGRIYSIFVILQHQ